jgi:hypothetical protein
MAPPSSRRSRVSVPSGGEKDQDHAPRRGTVHVDDRLAVFGVHKAGENLGAGRRLVVAPREEAGDALAERQVFLADPLEDRVLLDQADGVIVIGLDRLRLEHPGARQPGAEQVPAEHQDFALV